MPFVTWLLSPLGRLVGVGVLSLIIGGVGAGWGVAKIKDAQIASIQAADAKADADRANAVLKKFQEQAAIITASAQAYLTIQGDLDLKIAGLKNDIGKIHFKTPLPANCRSTPDRLRNLGAAIDAANAAARAQPGTGTGLPPAH